VGRSPLGVKKRRLLQSEVQDHASRSARATGAVCGVGLGGRTEMARVSRLLRVRVMEPN
jgi:hypothetical protein